MTFGTVVALNGWLGRGGWLQCERKGESRRTNEPEYQSSPRQLTLRDKPPLQLTNLDKLFSKRPSTSNLLLIFANFLRFCIRHTAPMQDLIHKPSVRFDTLNHLQVWMKTPIYSQKDGTCLELFCVPKDLVSLLKPVSRLATAVAVSHFKWAGQIFQSRQKHSGEKATKRAEPNFWLLAK